MFLERIGELSRIVEQCACTATLGSIDHEQALQMACSALLQTREMGGIVYVIGNGGSAGIASHFYADLMKVLEIPSSTLFDSNLTTCISNDYGYEVVFSAPLKILLREEDLLIAISSSGKSRNILNAVEVAQEKGARVITLSGFLQDNPLRKKGMLNFFLDVEEYSLVEMGHLFILRVFIDYLQKRQFSGQQAITACVK
ncbi:MAG: SIS domain-containing protein [Simkania sp.]|nr:SIS domain-containing protein [Simkania sp.]